MKDYRLPAIIVTSLIVLAVLFYFACALLGWCIGGLFEGKEVKSFPAKKEEPTLVKPAEEPEVTQPVQPRLGGLEIDFQYGTARYLSGAEVEQIAQEVAEMLMENPSKKVYLIGHTCTIGTKNHNENLGDRRAAVIKSSFIRLGVPAKSIVATSEGEAIAAKDPDSEEHRDAHRRVVVKIK